MALQLVEKIFSSQHTYIIDYVKMDMSKNGRENIHVHVSLALCVTLFTKFFAIFGKKWRENLDTCFFFFFLYKCIVLYYFFVQISTHENVDEKHEWMLVIFSFRDKLPAEMLTKNMHLLMLYKCLIAQTYIAMQLIYDTEYRNYKITEMNLENGCEWFLCEYSRKLKNWFSKLYIDRSFDENLLRGSFVGVCLRGDELRINAFFTFFFSGISIFVFTVGINLEI